MEIRHGQFMYVRPSDGATVTDLIVWSDWPASWCCGEGVVHDDEILEPPVTPFDDDLVVVTVTCPSCSNVIAPAWSRLDADASDEKIEEARAAVAAEAEAAMSGAVAKVIDELLDRLKDGRDRIVAGEDPEDVLSSEPEPEPYTVFRRSQDGSLAVWGHDPTLESDFIEVDENDLRKRRG